LEGRFCDFYDPRRHPSKARTVIASPLLSLLDLPRLLRYASLFPDRHPEQSGESTLSSLARYRFSERFRTHFLLPFLSGVLLDPTLSIDSAAARFYLRVLSDSQAILPQQGIQALPNFLAQQVGVSHILLRSPVESVRPTEVVLRSGDVLSCQKVLVCTDALAASTLGGPEQTMPHLSSRTIYFSAQAAPYAESLVALNGEGRGVICNVAIPSNVQPSYAPAGKALIAATVVGAAASTEDSQSLSAVRDQLVEWFGHDAREWRHLRTFTIRASVPARPRMGIGAREHNQMIFAGDYLSYGSQNGALRAGREAARLALESLGR
jgi:phytoene dehydrogenase-like protein